MDNSESDAWWHAASPESARKVASAAHAAMEDWHGRLGDVAELLDLEVFCRPGRLCPVRAAQAAALAAAEVEILVQIWPTRPDVALRPKGSPRAVR